MAATSLSLDLQWFVCQDYFSHPSKAPDDGNLGGKESRTQGQGVHKGPCFDLQSSPSGNRQEPAHRPTHTHHLSPEMLGCTS